MARGNEEITALRVYGRLLRKLTRPGVMRSLVESRRLNPETRDSLAYRLEVAARQWPDRPAIKFEDRVLTWREFNATCNRYAHTLTDLGVGRGDVVVVNIINRPEMLLCTMAALKIGAIAALVNTGQTGESLAHSMNLVKPRAVITGEEQLDVLGTIDDLDDVTDTWIYCADHGERGCPDGWIDLDLAAQAASTEDPPGTSEITLGHPAVYIYTSGTTGLPKAAVTPHSRLRMGGLMVGKVVQELGPDDTVFSALPLYHSTGLLGGWAACVHTGASLAIARRFSAADFWDDIRRFEATCFSYVGEVLRYLLNQPPHPDDRRHRVRAIYGAGLRPEIWHEFKERFGIEGIHEVYGASESPSGFLNLLNFDRTCGWNPRGWKTVAFDTENDHPVRGADGHLQEVGPGSVGLLIMKVDEHQRFEGYTDEAATTAKVVRDAFTPGDTWFNTGDLVLNQGHGHVRFADRTGDTFRWTGENVATTEVEGVASSWPQIDQAVVYGVEVSGTEGRCGMALVLLEDGEELDLAGFATHLRDNLPRYAVPRFLRVGQEVAMTGTFRFQKFELKREAYDPDQVGDPLYLLTPSDDAFRPLTASLRDQVDRREIRL